MGGSGLAPAEVLASNRLNRPQNHPQKGLKFKTKFREHAPRPPRRLWVMPTVPMWPPPSPNKSSFLRHCSYIFIICFTSVSRPAIPAGGLGVLGGAVLVYFTKSKGKTLAFIPWVVSIFGLPAALGFLFSCPDVNIAGIHTVVGNRYLAIPSVLLHVLTCCFTSMFSSMTFGSSDILLSSCNNDCMCNSSIFEPVCGADGLTYFSPCRAGCEKFYVNGNPNVRASFVKKTRSILYTLENTLYSFLFCVCRTPCLRTVVVWLRTSIKIQRIL